MACGLALLALQHNDTITKQTPSLVLKAMSQLFQYCTVNSGIDTFSDAKNGTHGFACENDPLVLLPCRCSIDTDNDNNDI